MRFFKRLERAVKINSSLEGDEVVMKGMFEHAVEVVPAIAVCLYGTSLKTLEHNFFISVEESSYT